jgi:hypothetical protein
MAKTRGMDHMITVEVKVVIALLLKSQEIKNAEKVKCEKDDA